MNMANDKWAKVFSQAMAEFKQKLPGLRPCPFCGGQYLTTSSKVVGHGDADEFIQCRRCGACAPPGNGELDRINKWNTRYEIK